MRQNVKPRLIGFVTPGTLRRAPMNAKSNKTLNEIEASQNAMRESIEMTKSLSEQTDRLIKRHRKELEEDR
jgi:hypothetical protein